MSLTDHELMQLRREGQLTQETLDKLKPFFQTLKDFIHEKWEKLPLEDGQGAKLLKFQLKSVNELERLILKEIGHGKQAAKKLEVKNGN